MRVIKWTVSGIIVAALIFGTLQVFLLNEKGSEQSKILTQLNQQVSLLNDSVLEQGKILTQLNQQVSLLNDNVLDQSKILTQFQLDQNSNDFLRILDLGINVGTFPYTNHRGTTAISAMPIGSPSPLPGPVVYILRDGTHPELLLDILAYNKKYTTVDPIFVTASDTVLAFTGDYSDGNHILAKILRITLDGKVTEVYSYDSGAQDPGGYFWGEDSLNGTIWKGHKVEGGIRIIKSTDDGRTWTVKYGAAYDSPPYVYEIAAFDDSVFAVIANLVLYSADGGENWSEVLKLETNTHGISIFGGVVYVVTTGEEIYISPGYNQPYNWMRIYLPRGISLTDTTVFRQTKMLGRYIVTAALALGSSATTYWATADNFYTISPLFRFGPTNRGMNERYSGFGNTIYIGGSNWGDGTVWKAKIPETLSVRIPTLRTMLDIGSLAAGATSGGSWVFDSRLSPTFTLNVRATYDNLATQGIKVHVVSSADGRYFDSVDAYTEIHPFAAGQGVAKTYAFSSAGVIMVQIENLDKSHAVTGIKVIGTLGALGD